MTCLVCSDVVSLRCHAFCDKANMLLILEFSMDKESCNDRIKMEDLKKLFSKIAQICAKAEQIKEEKRKRGEYFNVFTTLGLWSEEVRLHSSFLAELLNPNGNHGMGASFLAHFLRLVGEQPDYIQSDKVNQNIVERFIGEKTVDEGGRLDIIIEDGNHAIIIENKIYADEQEHQLLRYDNYGKVHFPNGYHLVYLTLDGHEASDFSTGGKRFVYTCRSYSSDIIAWLYECVKIAYDKPLVRETIKQYIQLIKQLTNQDMGTEDMKAIAELAIENIEATCALMESNAEIGALLRKRYIFEPLNQFAEENNLNIEISDSIQFKQPSWKHRISVTSDGRAWHKLYIGIDSGKEEPQQMKLECLHDAPAVFWPFGSEYLPFGDWDSSSSYPEIKNGNVADWIMKRVKAILQEIEEKRIQM